MQPDRDLVTRFDEAGGAGKPVVGGLKVCFDRDRGRAIRTARELWAIEALPGELGQILPTPAHFEQASSLVTDEMVQSRITCGDDADAYVEAVREYADAGFTEIYIGHIGPRYEEFFDFYREALAPRLTSSASARRSEH